MKLDNAKQKAHKAEKRHATNETESQCNLLPKDSNYSFCDSIVSEYGQCESEYFFAIGRLPTVPRLLSFLKKFPSIHHPSHTLTNACFAKDFLELTRTSTWDIALGNLEHRNPFYVPFLPRQLTFSHAFVILAVNTRQETYPVMMVSNLSNQS